LKKNNKKEEVGRSIQFAEEGNEEKRDLSTFFREKKEGGGKKRYLGKVSCKEKRKEKGRVMTILFLSAVSAEQGS